MVRYICDGSIDKGYQNCHSEDFIYHENGEIQCARCGKYLPKDTIELLSFAKKYDIYIHKDALQKKIEETSAKEIITVLFGFKYWSNDADRISAFNHLEFYGNRMVVYKGEGNPFVAYYLNLGEGRGFGGTVSFSGNSFSVEPRWTSIEEMKYPFPGKVTADLLFISDELPYWYIEGGTSTYSIPVKGPDQLVYTGATVGGVSTGGFHIQEGKTRWEYVSYTSSSKWALVANMPCIEGKKARLVCTEMAVFTHTNEFPNRFAPYFLDYDENDYFASKRVIWKLNGKSINLRQAIRLPLPFFPQIPIDQIYHDLIYGTVPDEEYYQQACQLATSNTREDLLKASNCFNLLGDYKDSLVKKETCIHEAEKIPPAKTGGCYVATAVYGSYDCPEVWTLRRYRDFTLAETWYGRAFIRTYYAISPTLVRWFGETKWFKNMWKPKLDRMVKELNENGVADTPYQDRNW